jgi:hypothetical protein
MRERVLSEKDRTEQVRGEFLLGHLPVDRPEQGRTDDRGIVYQDVDAAERFERGGDDGRRGVRQGDIGRELGARCRSNALSHRGALTWRM